jgi:hypothetical protein
VTWQGAAYVAYAVGSVLFVILAVDRGSPLLVVGSALFLLGTLLFVVPKLTRQRRGRHAA